MFALHLDLMCDTSVLILQSQFLPDCVYLADVLLKELACSEQLLKEAGLGH